MMDYIILHLAFGVCYSYLSRFVAYKWGGRKSAGYYMDTIDFVGNSILWPISVTCVAIGIIIIFIKALKIKTKK